MKPVNELTRQEAVVLALVARGLRNIEIAQELVITTKTVEAHLSRIFDKLGVSSRTQAALYAVHHKLLSGENVG
ncbi:MAG: LuxR C-terminal-related transcriptional regulator [Anaerolineae bacterium]